MAPVLLGLLLVFVCSKERPAEAEEESTQLKHHQALGCLVIIAMSRK
jgi:hypothetical protein